MPFSHPELGEKGGSVVTENKHSNRYRSMTHICAKEEEEEIQRRSSVFSQ